MSDYLFNTTNFYNHDFKCNDPIKFRDFIKQLESGKNPNILNDYIKSNGQLYDVCYMIQKGNGELYIVSIPRAIINGGNLETLKRLIELDKSYINYQDHEYSLLSYAIGENNEMANYLLDSGADPNSFGHRSKTPLYYAILQVNVEIIDKLLILGANPNHTYGMQKTNYLYFAVYKLSIIKNNKTASDTDSENDIHMVQKMNLMKIIKLLIKYGGIIQEDLYTSNQLNLINNIKNNL